MPPPSKPRSRIQYLDTLRVFLTTLVILHHTAIPYGGLGEQSYLSEHHHRGTSAPLVVFNILNQTFFMALFFYLSGFNSRAALTRRSTSAFLTAKLTRLGIPCVAYAYVSPLAQSALISWLNRTPFTVQSAWRLVKSIRGVAGATWYLALLLVFDTTYALMPADVLAALDRAAGNASLPTVMLLDCAATFAVRLMFPISWFYRLMNLRVGYLPQYVFAYVAGARDVKLGDMNRRFVWWSAGMALGAVSIACAAAAYGFAKSSQLPVGTLIEDAQGGWNVLAALYAVWNEVTGYLLGGVVLDLFKVTGTRFRGLAVQNLARYAYATFLVHSVVSVAVEVACDELWIDWGLGKFFVVGILNVLACWSAGWLLCQVPGVKTVVL